MEKSYGFHQDNAPARNAFSVKTFLAMYDIPVLDHRDHPPYSSDLTPCVFYLFPKVKYALKGTRFQTFETVNEKAAHVMNKLTGME